MKTLRIKIFVIMLFVLFLICITLTVTNSITRLSSTLLETKNELEYTKETNKITISNLKNELKISESAVLKQYDINYKMNDIIKDTDDYLIKLRKSNKSLKKELENATNRLLIYETYDYIALDNGKRTDVTYDELVLGETLMKENGYDPNLLFGIVMVESRGNADAVNPRSGASGYGQFMKYTGEYVYENLLNKGSYNHFSTPFNGEINIEMMAEYLDYLNTKYKNNTFKSIKEYCGGGNIFTSQYIAKINSVLPDGRSIN